MLPSHCDLFVFFSAFVKFEVKILSCEPLIPKKAFDFFPMRPPL